MPLDIVDGLAHPAGGQEAKEVESARQHMAALSSMALSLAAPIDIVVGGSFTL